MKKKIVYISGADAFDVSDIRAAFDEVRATMGLDSDTILFGVPVDSQIESDVAIDVTPEPAEPVTAVEQEPEVQEVIKQEIDESCDATVVPILSVLGGDTNKSVEICESVADSESQIESVDDTVEPDMSADITEMLDDDLPIDAGEKTLEELLETMAPLDEDVRPEVEPVAESNVDKETDATLENLASEFATAQIKPQSPKKSSERGRIGKLKNILPFKNKKRDDSGLMGDLFGWAGVAANDEDFTIPGFFTNAVGNK